MFYKKYFDYNGQGYNKIKVGFNYELGGNNYFSNSVSPRGLYLYFMPVTLEKNDGYTSESYMLFGGGAKKCLVLPMKRKNTKKIQEFIASLEDKLAEIAEATHNGTIKNYLFSNKLVA